MAVGKVRNRKALLKPAKQSRKEKENQQLHEIKEKLKKGITQGYTESPPTLFEQLPLSTRTMEALEKEHFVEMTDIQKCAIPVALEGHDLLGSARTGSGKTLAFLIPLVELLWRQGWTTMDGLGALVISPTRELALQTFKILTRIGGNHTLSAGLLIGGKDLEAERSAIGRMNILVCTPGRLLQHLDSSVDFEWSLLKMLVLDEADRCLDLGFSACMDAIIKSLEGSAGKRQTLLFSATQSASIQRLAKLSLKNPLEIAVHPSNTLPSTLTQHYLQVKASTKIDHLWTWIKSHLSTKTLVFTNSCKQVRFLYEAFCRLQPGMPIQHLYGRQKQWKRQEIYEQFNGRQRGLLICTDVAARGLDFAGVDWIVQWDLPEDADTYVHRVGRSARYGREGNALLFLLPQEMPFLSKELPESINATLSPLYPPTSTHSLTPKRSIIQPLTTLCTSTATLKHLAQRAIVSYVKSCECRPIKYGMSEVDVEELSLSCGLVGAPKIKRRGQNHLANKNAPINNGDCVPAGGVGVKAKNINRQLAASIGQLQKQSKSDDADNLSKDCKESDSLDDDDDAADSLFTVKGDNDAAADSKDSVTDTIPVELVEEEKPVKPLTRKQILKSSKPVHVKFGDDSSDLLESDVENSRSKVIVGDGQGESKEELDTEDTFIERAKRSLRQADKEDYQRTKNLKRQRTLKKKQKTLNE